MKSVDGYEPVDPFFGKPFIDEDRDEAEPLPHRYLHGGFDGTDTRFSFYLPPKEQWQGRMMQTFGGAAGGNERSVQTMGAVANAYHNAFTNGAYLIESNQGHFGPSMEGLKGDLTILNGRADVETARLSWAVAEEVYGARPHHSYCYGGSGGGNRTLFVAETAPHIYDGAVPFMFGGSSSSLTLNAVRVLAPVIDDVIEATAPGGSGNPFDGLTTVQRDALAALYRGGFQHGGEHQLRPPIPEVGWTSIRAIETLRATDPDYFDVFWSDPGHAGADGLLDSEVIDEEVRVDAVLAAQDIAVGSNDGFVPIMLRSMVANDLPLGVRLSGIDGSRLMGARVRIGSGAAAGRSWYCFLVIGDVLIPSGEGSFFDPALVDGLAAGDTVRVDNRDLLAYCGSDRHYARHPLATAQFEVSGVPVYPRRDDSPELLAATGMFTGRSVWTGRFGATKMILQQHRIDRICWPPIAIGYHRAVAEHLGERVDDQFRIWFTERAQHGPTMTGTPDATRAIDYSGSISQGIRDVIAWVEDGIAPAATTAYELVDGQVVVPDDADLRGGIQPVVSATANGDAGVTVTPGAEVELAFTATVPTGCGTIVAAEWDLDGSGAFATTVDGINGSQRSLTAAVKHAFSEPGTHFATVRVSSHRTGDTTARTERVPNLARVRVVVT